LLEAQVNKCSLNLIEAREQYNLGMIEDVPPLLLDCIERGFNENDRIEAYKLLINSYIFGGYPDLADQYMMDFLNDYPNYEVEPDDPFEFISLFQQFDNKVRFSLGGVLGTNFTFIGVQEPFGVHNLNQEAGNYKISPGFSIGGQWNYYLLPRVEISVEPVISFTGYKYELEPYSFTSVNYTEKLSRFDIPLSVVYTLNDEEFAPYIRAGLRPSFLLSVKSELERSYTGGASSYSPITGDKEDVKDKRTSMLFSSFVGAGVRYNLSGSYFFADIRYYIGHTNAISSESHSAVDSDDTWLFYYMQDDFKSNELAITVGYNMKFYNPKRKN